MGKAGQALSPLLVLQGPTAIWQNDSWTVNLGAQWVQVCAAKCGRFQREEQRGSCSGVAPGSRGSAWRARPSDLSCNHLASPTAALKRCAFSDILLLRCEFFSAVDNIIYFFIFQKKNKNGKCLEDSSWMFVQKTKIMMQPFSVVHFPLQSLTSCAIN